jgi:NAD(P)H-dependent FMN reductase
MITVVSGTNRKNSECLQFARAYCELLCRHTSQEVKLLALEDIPHDWFHPHMYEKDGQRTSLIELQDAYMIPAEKFAFLSPEYNGGFPGALKLFLDACSVRAYEPTFKGKKAALIGIASGRAGNLRGMDHLSGILNHVGIIVLPNKLPISRIGAILDEAGKVADERTLRVMEKQALELLDF